MKLYINRVQSASAVASWGHQAPVDGLFLSGDYCWRARRLYREFVVQSADHTARIEGEDLKITWKYSGYCRSDRASAFDFSIDSGTGISFQELNCVAYDLGHDPDMVREIRPLLVGPEGISKKISVPLLEPLKADQTFGLLLKCTLPRCVTTGTGSTHRHCRLLKIA